MQLSYDFSGLLCFSKTNQTSAQPLCPSLVPHDTSEARVGGNSFFWTSGRIYSALVLIMCTANKTNMLKNMLKSCQSLSMHKKLFKGW